MKSTFSNPLFGAICCCMILNWLELFCHSWVKIVFVPYIIRRPALQNRKMLHPAVLDNTLKPKKFWKCLKMSKPLQFHEHFLNYHLSSNPSTMKMKKIIFFMEHIPELQVWIPIIFLNNQNNFQESHLFDFFFENNLIGCKIRGNS